MTSRQLHAWIRLSLCRSVGARTWNHWLTGLAAAGLSLEKFLELPEHEARPLLNQWTTIAHALRQEAPTSGQLDQLVKQLEREKIRLLPISDPHYPARLLSDLGLDAPTFLYVAGNLSLLRGPTIALVGTRNPSALGQESARAYASVLAREGVHVVSGNARGIDTAAHEGALAGGGSTTLVLPCGIFARQVAPPLEAAVAHDQALILSQFAPEAHTGPDLPILRNSTIAALGEGLVVVESGLLGGTAHAFRQARRLRKPLWAVIYPPPIPPSASGNHSLLFAGAQRLEPGQSGAEQCVARIIERLRDFLDHRPAPPTWPLAESPGQGELF